MKTHNFEQKNENKIHMTQLMIIQAINHTNYDLNNKIIVHYSGQRLRDSGFEYQGRDSPTLKLCYLSFL